MDEDRKGLVERVVDATGGRVTKVQNDVGPVVSATRDRTTAVLNKAQEVAAALPLATREDVAKLQGSLDRIEALLAELVSQGKPAPRKRAPAKPTAEEQAPPGSGPVGDV
jgi:hypothetical protein